MNTNILVAYYSWTGNTAKIAKEVSERVGGSLFEIKRNQPYEALVRESKKENERRAYPKLAVDIDIAAYETIFVGTPNWWRTLAPPVATFLKDKDFAGKTIIPFCSHGGGGWGEIQTAVRAFCIGGLFMDGFSAKDGACDLPVQVQNWLKEIDYIK